MKINDWLLKPDLYEPKADKENFLDKTILGFVGVLSKIKRENERYTGFIYGINATVKLASTFLIIIFLSLTRNVEYIFCTLAYSMVCLATLDRNVIKKILKASVGIPIFTIIMLAPSLLLGNSFINCGKLTLKIFITILIVNIFSYTTKCSEAIKSLKVFAIPDIFIFVFDITIRYIYILGDFSLNMLYSLKLKSVGKNNKKRQSLSKIIGILFLKSNNMGDEMYSAMECRGFNGKFKSRHKVKLNLNDYIYCAITCLMIGAFFVI
ncbi:MAG: energy-coupling factor transporter transmembrane protein EcfT [Clostridium perfringens]|uniref:energy-coupling factor transporter transmembrane component T n=1 Tax=Clostridium perfringens TaxID=1502 RepID=UPI0021473897|nr:energy-coupling factor transporter transmembrane component T [Clostridium perfringens]ELC8423031.1 energy-coupling factor transporter transmembrane protein EcfT [Clostridium perfringens]MCI5748707.1 energy-coupling factor transporter transmembrane protein EcfT [Clostridium perfringens]MDY4419605.1 energy-coupling factor transporter transmembrane component T [Clostridium perfringens]UUR88377.1 energy-coupling factor transporter transmembrane protein EcfT [Clostridium perfringens]